MFFFLILGLLLSDMTHQCAIPLTIAKGASNTINKSRSTNASVHLLSRFANLLKFSAQNFTFVISLDPYHFTSSLPPRTTTSTPTSTAKPTKMLSDTIVEFLYHTCVLWIWSTAIMIAITLVVEALLPVEFESGTQFQILLLIFFILNALRMELRGVDVSAESAAAPAKAKDVVTPCKPTVIIRDCDHSAKDLEIETLKAAKAELETSIAEERKSTFDTEEQRKLQQERADEFSWKLQCTKERCAAEYRTHMDVSNPLRMTITTEN